MMIPSAVWIPGLRPKKGKRANSCARNSEAWLREKEVEPDSTQAVRLGRSQKGNQLWRYRALESSEFPLRSSRIRVLLPGYRVGLRTLLAVDDIEFNLVSLFQRFVSIYLNGGVMYENIRSVFATDEAEAFGVVEPLNRAFVLSHRISSFLFSMLAALWEEPLRGMT
jgi:hypothetical protein